MESKKLLHFAAERGISDASIQRAKQSLGVDCRREGQLWYTYLKSHYQIDKQAHQRNYNQPPPVPTSDHEEAGTDTSEPGTPVMGSQMPSVCTAALPTVSNRDHEGAGRSANQNPTPTDETITPPHNPTTSPPRGEADPFLVQSNGLPHATDQGKTTHEILQC